MKNNTNFFGVIAILASVGLLLTSCPNATGPNQPEIPTLPSAVLGTWLMQGSLQSSALNFDQTLVISGSNWNISSTDIPGNHAHFAVSSSTSVSNTTGIFPEYPTGYRFDGSIVSRQGFPIFEEISYFFVFLHTNGQRLRIYWGGGRVGIMERVFVKQ